MCHLQCAHLDGVTGGVDLQGSHHGGPVGDLEPELSLHDVPGLLVLVVVILVDNCLEVLIGGRPLA